MAEFKRLSEVEQIETASDNATVLIEEGGDIKRVPKSAVGGAGGYVIKLENSYIGGDGLFWLDENYDELYDVLMSRGSVWVDYTNAPEQLAPSAFASQGALGLWESTNWGPNQSQVVCWFLTDTGLALADFMGFINSGNPNIFFPNGSHNLPANELPPS